MKTLTQVQKYSKTLVQIATALVAVIAMTGCGKKSNNNQNVVNPWGYGQPGCTTGCVGGPNGGGQVAEALGRSGDNQTQMLIRLFAQGGQVGQPGSYAGQVAASGTIVSMSNLWASCGIPGGNHEFTTVQPGTMRGTIVENLVIRLNSTGVQIVINGSLNYPQYAGSQYPYAFYGNATAQVQGYCTIALY